MPILSIWISKITIPTTKTQYIRPLMTPLTTIILPKLSLVRFFIPIPTCTLYTKECSSHHLLLSKFIPLLPCISHFASHTPIFATVIPVQSKPRSSPHHTMTSSRAPYLSISPSSRNASLHRSGQPSAKFPPSTSSLLLTYSFRICIFAFEFESVPRVCHRHRHCYYSTLNTCTPPRHFPELACASHVHVPNKLALNTNPRSG